MYTPEETKIIEETYKENPSEDTIASLAETLSKSTRSVIAKLTKMGLYKAKGYVSKSGLPPIKKEEIVEQIAVQLNTSAEALPGLEKANKATLLKLLKAVSCNQN